MASGMRASPGPRALSGSACSRPEDCYWRGTTADVILSACTAQLRKDPADAGALVKRGMALIGRGEFARARADLDAAIAVYTKADDYKLGDA